MAGQKIEEYIFFNKQLLVNEKQRKWNKNYFNFFSLPCTVFFTVFMMILQR